MRVNYVQALRKDSRKGCLKCRKCLQPRTKFVLNTVVISSITPFRLLGLVGSAVAWTFAETANLGFSADLQQGRSLYCCMISIVSIGHWLHSQTLAPALRPAARPRHQERPSYGKESGIVLWMPT